MTEEKLPTADEFRAEVLQDVERLHLQRKQLNRTVDRIEDEIQSLVELSIQLGIEQLPTADAPPLLLSITRGEIARAIFHVRRAGRCAVRIGLVTDGLAVALEALRKFEVPK